MGGAQRMPNRLESGGEARGQQRAGDEPVDGIAADRLQAVDQAEARKPGQKEAGPVEASPALAARVWNEDDGERQSDRPERYVEEEDPLPRAIGRDQSA